MPRLRPLAVRRAGVLLLLLTLPLAAQVANDDPSALPSEILPRAAHSLLLDVARTDAGWFAVGERGHVLSSSDGQDWKQVQVPTRSALTSIEAVGELLWAGGHDGVILHSGDGGKTWTAQRRDPFALAEGQDTNDRDPRQGAPVMDLHFSDARNGIAVGAYSLMLVTADGGKTWTPKQAIAPSAEPEAPVAPMEGDIFSAEDLMLDEESDPHFNAIAATGDGGLVIVGERGTVLRSTDAGASWQKQAFPYKGSMFGVLGFGGGRLLAFGLRGNVYESHDDGASWAKVPAGGSASLMGGVALADGGAVLVGANGTVLHRPTGDAPLAVTTFRNAAGESPTLAGVAPADGGRFVLVGDKGADLATLQ
jgi:photosystem II stability/assembly factor-like uncharacterized protein